MSYLRFAVMIFTSTLVHVRAMYFNTYAWEHAFFSETRAYMAVMGATMASPAHTGQGRGCPER